MIINVYPPRDGAADARFEMLMQQMDHASETRRKIRCLPAEWAPQSGVQLTWPHEDTDWADRLEEVTETYLRMAFEIAKREPLIIVTPKPDEVETLLRQRMPKAALEQISLFECPTDDTWARDHGFITIEDTDGLHLMDFRFNGWGGKFPAEHDDAINARLAQSGMFCGLYDSALDFELEGGAIESDGAGTLLTTAACLLNPNRRRRGDAVSTPDKAAVERLLGERLGAKRVLWLHHGYLVGDDTDSHIDTLARLCPNQTIAYVKCEDTADEHYAELHAMEEELMAFRTAEGEPYRLLPLPMPAPCLLDDERLPATYANFLILNDAVLVPVYAQPQTDEVALRQIAKAFPGRDIVGIDCRTLIVQHGSLHCCTMQFPRGVFGMGLGEQRPETSSPAMTKEQQDAES